MLSDYEVKQICADGREMAAVQGSWTRTAISRLVLALEESRALSPSGATGEAVACTVCKQPLRYVDAGQRSVVARCACSGGPTRPLITAAPPAPAPAGEVDIGLHTRVEIHYEVDLYRAELVFEAEEDTVCATAFGETPSAALNALAVALSRAPGGAE